MSSATSSPSEPGSGRVAEKTPPRWLLPFFRQFGHPKGFLGHIATKAMARGNRDVNTWVLDVLDVTAHDAVLDVGCGPGVALQIATERGATAAGVDVSEVAVGQARRRNPGGRVEVASVDDLPFSHGEFTRAMSVNSMGFWPDPEAGVREICRVLAPSGRLAIALRMKIDEAKPTDRRAYGSTPDQIAKVENLLRHVGFVDVARHEAKPAGEATTVVIGTKA